MPDRLGSPGRPAPLYAYSFNTPFTLAPTVALVTLAGMDGVNGGWAQIHGGTVATADTLFLSPDEDQLASHERRHMSEQVGYVVVDSPGMVP